MPIHVNCVDCCVELTFPDAMAGRTVRCPTCDAEFVAPGVAAPVAAVANGGTPVAREERIRATRPANYDHLPEVEPVEPERKQTPAREQRVIASRPVKAQQQVDAVPESDVELVEEPEASSAPGAPPAAEAPPEAGAAPADQESPRKKKRKRKRRKAESFPAWVWWLAAAGVGTVGVFTAVLIAVTALKQSALGFVIGLVILMPISMGIMVLSMYITSALGGGVDFGDARVAIPKAAALLFVINAINLSDCGMGGYWVTLPFWIFGLMILFRLDFWEAKIMFLVNWGFGCILRWVALGLLVSAATHMHDHPDQYRKKGPSTDDMILIQELGGEFEYGKGAGHPVVGIKLRGPKVRDFHLDLVKGFPELRSLDLERSSVTDVGLQQIAEMHQLKEVVVAQTLVSAFGVAKLQQERPDLKIIR
jgi:hypothetical protein